MSACPSINVRVRYRWIPVGPYPGGIDSVRNRDYLSLLLELQVPVRDVHSLAPETSLIVGNRNGAWVEDEFPFCTTCSYPAVSAAIEVCGGGNCDSWGGRLEIDWLALVRQ